MCENYRRLLREGVTLLRRLNPTPNPAAGLYCPEAADAVDDFLRDGEIHPVQVSGLTTFEMRVGGIAPASLGQIVAAIGRCAHRVICGHRPDNSTHWFVIFNVDGQHHVADAMLMLDPAITRPAGYVQSQNFSRLRMVSGDYQVTLDDPMNLDNDIFGDGPGVQL